MTSVSPPGMTTGASVLSIQGDRRQEFVDELATEEPLEMRVRYAGREFTAAVTMRTPGNDFELAAGFLMAEGMVEGRDAVAGISYCIDPAVDAAQRYNIVTVELRTLKAAQARQLERHFTMTSACGICGKASIEALSLRAQRLADPVRVPLERIASSAGKMREAQRVFASTGGLHAAALFDAGGELLALREDVGRHNALDKLIGWALLQGLLPLQGCIAVLSGRASYELVQKCIVAAVPIVCAVSAPTSLAVQLAQDFGVTLLGFVREGRANVYAGAERIALR